MKSYPDKKDSFYDRWSQIARGLMLLSAKNKNSSFNNKVIKEYENAKGQPIDANDLSGK